jgi:iron(III) transport system ATP-binding protein
MMWTPMSQRTDQVVDEAIATKSHQVKVTSLSKTFHSRGSSVKVLDSIDLHVDQGEFLVLLGPSGCGKTTLLRCLVGLERPDSGRIELGGKTVVDGDSGVFAPPNKRDVAMVFQNYALWPHMRVNQNVAYPLKARRMKDAIRKGRVNEVLEIVQCAHLADRYPPELSGGQQQRVSLARALAPSPSLLLLDEPLSNLDVLLRVELRAQLRLLQSELNVTAVHVTHDQEEALALGTRVAVMNRGRIEQIGNPSEVYRSPSTEYVADFLGARNRLVAHADHGITTIAGQHVKGVLSPDLNGEFHLRSRMTDLSLREASDQSHVDPRTAWLPGAQLIEILPGGESSEYVAQIGGTRVFVAVPNGSVNVHPGDAIDVGIDLTKTFCYDELGNAVSDWRDTPSLATLR